MKKTVVVHRGARDNYQVAAALAEAGLLECLVTDLYWPNDRKWASRLAAFNPSVKRMLMARSSPFLPAKLVQQTLFSGLLSHCGDKFSSTPFALRRHLTRWTDGVMGRAAGSKARAANAGLLSYSYYGYHAFAAYGQPGILFQAHPHPASVRRILQQELEANPECAPSLRKEWELSLPQEDFERLVAETKMAAQTLTASSFTRRTLVENGVDRDSISVIPYGVDPARFHPAPPDVRRPVNGHLKLLFVGTINQRKGIKYLLEAVKLAGSKQIELTVCGRVVDDLSLFKSYKLNVNVRPSIGAAELLEAYRSADLFVFPSVVEGFAQVLLEALACGLPILSTTRTAAPDLIEHGTEGFIVEPARPDHLADRIEWCLANRQRLVEMRAAALRRAAYFTWARFRAGIVEAVQHFQPEDAAQYV